MSDELHVGQFRLTFNEREGWILIGPATKSMVEAVLEEWKRALIAARMNFQADIRLDPPVVRKYDETGSYIGRRFPANSHQSSDWIYSNYLRDWFIALTNLDSEEAST